MQLAYDDGLIKFVLTRWRLMSAFEGKADSLTHLSECLLIAISGHSRLSVVISRLPKVGGFLLGSYVVNNCMVLAIIARSDQPSIASGVGSKDYIGGPPLAQL